MWTKAFKQIFFWTQYCLGSQVLLQGFIIFKYLMRKKEPLPLGFKAKQLFDIF
jgi:hypothetical protein